MKARIFFILKLLFAVALVWWILQKGHLDVNSLKRALNPGLLVVSFFLVLVNVILNNYRWMKLLRSQGIQVKLQSALPLTFVGLFFNVAVPGGVGGDVVKGYYFMRLSPNQKMMAAVCIFLDRYIGMFSLVLLAAAALMTQLDLVQNSAELFRLSMPVFGLLLIFGASFLILFSGLGKTFNRILLKMKFLPAHQKIMSLLSHVLVFQKFPWLIFKALVLSLISQGFTLAFFILVGWTMDPTIPLWVFFFVGGVGLIATAFPIAPASIGVGQAIFLFLFNWALGRSSDVGTVLATVQQLINILLAMVGAYFYVRMKRHPGQVAQPETLSI